MFTQVLILEIKDKLAAFGKKDSALPSVNLPLEGDEEIAFILNGRNVRMRLNDLVNYLLGDRINVTASIPLVSGYYTLTTAIAAIPVAFKKIGFEITFETESGIWVSYKFKGPINMWTTPSYWTQLDNMKILSDTEYDALVADDAIDPTTLYYTFEQ